MVYKMVDVVRYAQWHRSRMSDEDIFFSFFRMQLPGQHPGRCRAERSLPAKELASVLRRFGGGRDTRSSAAGGSQNV